MQNTQYILQIANHNEYDSFPEVTYNVDRDRQQD
jgi:hypothetical protein